MFFSRRLFIALTPLVLGVALAACGGNGSNGSTRSAAERDDDMAMGDPKAPIVVIEYASLTCPHCADFHEEIFPELKKKYIDTGKVRFVFRQFPTPPVPYAVGGEAVARCAGPDKYFDLLDILYAKQRYWVTSNNPRKALMEMAATAGISQADFDACVSDEANIKRIQEVSKLAQEEFKITGTPSFVINGKLRPRVRTLESFEEIFNPILGIKPEPKPAPEADVKPAAEQGEDH
ncbi:MAG: DsbA family protein [Robiginitomaculum sp.]|nr:DsbA family protein [Robiginitomaculum sp.]MDQ7077146.1 DsbA family protein [Robiginitomaculum sp.]